MCVVTSGSGSALRFSLLSLVRCALLYSLEKVNYVLARVVAASAAEELAHNTRACAENLLCCKQISITSVMFSLWLRFIII